MKTSSEGITLTTLRNGMRLVHLHTARPVAQAGLLINTGSRDEHEDEHGMAHFIEHCLFKGTRKRKTFHILNRLDSVGGDLNAFTSKEETWIHATVLNSFLDRALELISDIAFGATFPSAEIEKEKAVIVDEIQSYLDSPSDMLFEEFEAMVFAGHALARNVIGTEESVRSFRRMQLNAFLNRRKQACNYVLSIVSATPPGQVQFWAEEFFGRQRLAGANGRRKKFAGAPVATRVVSREVHQAQWISGCAAYSYHQDKRLGLSLLNQLLGGASMNNKLSLSLRERHALTYHIESNYQPLSDTGLFYVYLGTDKHNLERCDELLQRELKSLMTKRLGTMQLHNLKKQVKGQIAISQDSGAALMFALGKSVQLYNRVEPLTEVFEKIDRLSASELLEIANEILDRKHWSTLTYRN